MFLLLPTLNLILSISGLGLGVVTIALIIDYFLYDRRFLGERIQPFLWPIVIAITGGTVALSLVYSEYFGFVPCSLCWLQRIALFPQALLSVFAHRLKDTLHFPKYGIGLSLFGLLVAVYQYIYQMLPPAAREAGFAPCLVDGSGADCAVKIIDLFGFVTFPFLSAITFTFLIMAYLYMLRPAKAQTL